MHNMSEPLGRVLVNKVNENFAFVTGSEIDYESSVVKSARRTMEVLEFLAEVSRPATTMEIAMNIDLPQSSASMLLRSLVALGYLRHCNTKRTYEPTLRLLLLGMWKNEELAVAQSAVAIMEQLHRETGECVVLAEQYQCFVRYIYVLQGTHEGETPYTPRGVLRPICTTAFGQMILSAHPDDKVRGLIHRARSDRATSNYGINAEQVAREVQRCRERQYGFTQRRTDRTSFYQLAALMPGQPPEHQLAVGLIASGDRFSERGREVVNRLFELIGSDRYVAIMGTANEIELPSLSQ